MSGLLGGVLPAIYSQADRAKRYLGGLLSDPVGRMQQAGGQAVDDLSKLGLLSEQAFNDPRNPMKLQDNAAARQLTDTYMNSVLNFAPVGMHVWHGSPHKFDRFDSSKIGTGEGAQAYGHGLYLAESPDVAKGYQQATSKDRFITSDGYFDPSQLEHLNVRAATRKGDLQGAIDVAKKYAAPDPDYPDVAAKAARDLAILERLKASGGITQNTGALYKVDLPDDAIAKMLDWDKPLSQQPREVREALTTIARGDEKIMQKFRELGPSAPANHAYAALTEHAVRMKKYEAMRNGIPESQAIPSLVYGQDVASKTLREVGIPGIRYLDGGSRGVGQGTSNFVVFPGNEGLLSILERNGQPLR